MTPWYPFHNSDSIHVEWHVFCHKLMRPGACIIPCLTNYEDRSGWVLLMVSLDPQPGKMESQLFWNHVSLLERNLKGRVFMKQVTFHQPEVCGHFCQIHLRNPQFERCIFGVLSVCVRVGVNVGDLLKKTKFSKPAPRYHRICGPSHVPQLHETYETLHGETLTVHLFFLLLNDQLLLPIPTEY